MLAANAKADFDLPKPPVSPDARIWEEIVGPVEPFLREVSESLLAQVDAFEPELADYARYALSSQGKQLRPALVALSGQAAGALNPDLVTAAVIIEMVHLATLVHDDVMDEATIRRSRPTLARQCGVSTSILVGDCLFAHALTLAAAFPTPEVCRAVAQATKVVCTGEILQNEQRLRVDLSREEYFRVLRMKTAELFALSCALGGRLAGASPREERALREYGMALGTAYQVYDDCVDLFGREEAEGKSLGVDAANGKVTLPIIVLIERRGEKARLEVEKMLSDWRRERLGSLKALIQEHEGLEESQRVIEELCRQAAEALEALPEAPARKALGEAAAFLSRRAAALSGAATG